MFGRRRVTAILLLVGLVTLGLGFSYKDACNDQVGWKDSRQYRSLCYTDITPLYWVRNFDDDAVPYHEHEPQPEDLNPDEPRGFLEYPVLTGLFMWLASMLGTWRVRIFEGTPGPETGQEFFYWNSFLLALLALGTIVLLVRLAKDPRRVLYFAAGSPLLLYAFHNWDLLALFFTVLGLYWFEVRLYDLSGVAFALGAASKLYPILIPPLLFLVLLRPLYDEARTAPGTEPVAAFFSALRRARTAWIFAATTIGGLVAVHLPFLISGSPKLVWATYEFHLKRTPNPETLWFALEQFARDSSFQGLVEPVDRLWLEPGGTFLFVAGYVALAAFVWWRRLGPRPAMLGATLVFLLLNKIFSVQYALWVLPFFALLPLPAWSYAFYAAADLSVYLTLFPSFLTLQTYGTYPHGTYTEVGLAVLARTLALAILLVLVVRQGLRTAWEPPGRPNGTAVVPVPK